MSPTAHVGGTCEGPFVQVPPNQGETGGLHLDFVCWLGILGQSACPEVPYNVIRPLLAVCLFFLNGAASGSFRDGRVGLHMYRQQYGFFDREGGNYACQGVGALIFSLSDFFDRPLGELLRGTPTGWLAPDVLLLGIAAGALPRILKIGRLHRLTKSTILLRLILCVGWAFESIPARSQPSLGLSWTIWVGTQFQIRSILWPIEAFFRLSLVCAECCEGVGQLARPPGGLGNRGRTSGRHFEELRSLAPSLNTWFLLPPMLC
ncbi:hypothetical protein CK203_005431 [Vitis vinifera]|uniref:Uncharacterized protein n=1 Tax=Vitis vinifera TaxID=29760 RepID=A0A438K3J0_VITVI|nr:hypothetical protein CK203_005431 [Vitis vinifera]